MVGAPCPQAASSERSSRGSQRSSRPHGAGRGGRLGPGHGGDHAEACSWEDVRPARGPLISPVAPESSVDHEARLGPGLGLPVPGAPLGSKCRTLGDAGPLCPLLPLPEARAPLGSGCPQPGRLEAPPPHSEGRLRASADAAEWPFWVSITARGQGRPSPLSPVLLPLPASLGPLPWCGHISRVSSAHS